VAATSQSKHGTDNCETHPGLIQQGHIPVCLLDWHVSEKYAHLYGLCNLNNTMYVSRVVYRSFSAL